MWPEFLRMGPRGILLGAAVFLVPWYLKRELANDPTGAANDPLKPRTIAPPADLFRESVTVEEPIDHLRKVWVRRWRAALKHNPEAVEDAANVTLAHTMLANDAALGDAKVKITGGNLVRRGASRFDKTRWTAVAEPEWGGPRPVWRWMPIRFYLSPDAAAAEWIRLIPGEAVQALERGSSDDYVDALVAAKLLNGRPDEIDSWKTELAAWYRTLSAPAEGEA